MPDVTAPMPGKIVAVKVQPGDRVVEEQELLVFEAMKMEMPIAAPVSGTVSRITCIPGDAVQGGDILAVID